MGPSRGVRRPCFRILIKDSDLGLNFDLFRLLNFWNRTLHSKVRRKKSKSTPNTMKMKSVGGWREDFCGAESPNYLQFHDQNVSKPPPGARSAYAPAPSRVLKEVVHQSGMTNTKFKKMIEQCGTSTYFVNSMVVCWPCRQRYSMYSNVIFVC